ncbi:hypothetical protein [Azospirillum sp. sgz301742]
MPKTEKMMVRFGPNVKATLAALAEEDNRSMAAEIEWLILSEARRRERERRENER